MTISSARPGARRDAGSRSSSHALWWSFGNTAGSKLGTLAIGIVLARLLGPEAFGTYAVALIALMAVLSFSELGVSLAIVRWPTDPRTIVPTVTTISIVTSLFAALGVYLVTPAFTSAMGDPGAELPVRLLSLCVVINGVSATPAALLQRHLRQDRRTIADQVNAWSGAVLAILLALLGFGALGLVLGRIVGSLASAALLLRFSPEPFQLGWRREHAVPLLHFGLPLAAASILAYIVSYVDQVAVGHYLTPGALGAYVLAFNLASWPVAVLSQPLRAVAPAVFSRLQADPEAAGESLQRFLRPLLILALPMCATLCAAAPHVIETVYGAQWLSAAEPLRWLAVYAAVRIVAELGYDYVVVSGRSRDLLVVQVLWAGTLTLIAWAAVPAFGLAGAAIAQVVTSGFVVLPAYAWLIHRCQVRVYRLARIALPLVLAAVGLGGSVYLAARELDSAVAGLALAGGLGFVFLLTAVALQRTAFVGVLRGDMTASV